MDSRRLELVRTGDRPVHDEAALALADGPVQAFLLERSVAKDCAAGLVAGLHMRRSLGVRS
jgi:hypothetical protein